MRKLVPFLFILLLTLALSSCGGHTHAYGDWETVTEANCTAEGEQRRECECGEAESRVIPRENHDTRQHEAISATCTEDGYSAWYDCEVCATVTVERQTVSALGHKAGEPDYTVLPTCVSEGTAEYPCVRCGIILETKQVDPIPHVKGTPVVETEASCTSEGLARVYCIECGVHLEDIITPMDSHTHGEYAIAGDQFATDGSHSSICGTCGASFNEESHSLTTVTVEPTYLTEGERYRRCTECGWESYKTYQPTLEQQIPDFLTPSLLTATFGDRLSDIALPEGFSFEQDGSTPVGAVGERHFTLTFTPEDNEDGKYMTVTGIDVVISVLPYEADVEVDFTPLDGLVYNGAPAPSPIINSSVAELVTVLWYSGGSRLTEAPVNAGEYVCEVSLGDPNCMPVMKSYTFTVAKAQRAPYLPELVEKVYNGEPFVLDTGAIDAPFTVKYFLEQTPLGTAPTEVGSYTARLTVPESANYSQHTELIRINIIPDEYGPVWADEDFSAVSSEDTYTLSATDDNGIAYYWVKVVSSGGSYDYDTDSADIKLVAGAAHYIYAFDRLGNVSAPFTVYSSKGVTLDASDSPDTPAVFIPDSIYPESGAVIDTPYVHLRAAGSAYICFGTSEDKNEMEYAPSTKLGFPFIDYLEEGVTYYWYASAGGADSEIYSFTYSPGGRDYSTPTLVSPADGATVTDEQTPLIATGNGRMTVYFKPVGYGGDYTQYNYFDNGEFHPYITYEWYAVDPDGNETEKRTFTYLPDPSSKNPEGIRLEAYPDGAYINDSYCMIEADVIGDDAWLMALSVHADGSYSWQKFTHKRVISVGLGVQLPDDGKFREMLTELENGDRVYYYVCTHATYSSRSEIRVIYVDTEAPATGTVTEAGDGRIALSVGSDNTGAAYYYRLPLGEWTEYSEELTLTPELARGSVELRAVDRAGNEAYASYTFGDTELPLPTLELKSGTIGTYTKETTALTVTPIEGIKSGYILDGVRTEITEPVTLTFDTDGVYTLYLSSSSESEAVSEPYRIMIDKTAPVIEEIYVPEDYGRVMQASTNGFSWVVGDSSLRAEYQSSAWGFVEFSVFPMADSIVDASGVEISFFVDGSSMWHSFDPDEDCRINLGYFIFEESGFYDLKLRLCDEAGNETILTYTLHLDQNGPTAESCTVYHDTDSGEAELKIRGIKDDLSHFKQARIAVFDLDGWQRGAALTDELVEAGGDCTELTYDLSELPSGELYFVLVALYDEFGNYNLLPTTVFYKQDSHSCVTTEDGLTFAVGEDGWELVKIDTDSTLLVLPEYFEGEAYTVATGALLHNTTVEEIFVPASVGGIEWAAFASSLTVTTVHFEGSAEEWEALADASALPEGAILEYSQGT